MKLLLKFLILSTILISCNPPHKKADENVQSALPPEERAEKILQDEVLAIHDEVMPKMDQLMRYKDQLLIKVDSIRSIDEDDQKIIELQENINQLKKADSAMMMWMRQFNAVRDSVSHEQRMEYLDKEKRRIEEVQKMMNTAIENARQKLDEH